MSRVALALLLAAAFPPACALAASSFRMPALFSSNMVLQRGAPALFSGHGAPGTRITIEPGWTAHTASARVAPDGTWRLKLPLPKEPGPFDLRVVAADTVAILRNVLVGEVWLCSGQSNMEMPLAGWPPGSPVEGSAAAIASAGDPALRLFTVGKKFSMRPESSYTGEWVECTSATAAPFSATGYFFGRSLRAGLGVPVGLVHSSWGGSPAESWTSATALSSLPEFREKLAWVATARETLQALGRWLAGHRSLTIDPAEPGHRWEDVDAADRICAMQALDDAGWRTVTVPGDWEDRGIGAFDGIAWYRRSVEIPASWTGHALTMRLGPIDDMDETWVNGVLVASRMGPGFWNVPRIYSIPDSLVTGTRLQIAIRVVDNMGGGGLWGNGEKLELSAAGLGDPVPLSGEWKLLPVAEYVAPLLYVLGAPTNDFAQRPRLAMEINSATPTALHNAMLAPLAPFPLRGAIWYQGEANIAQPELYARLFPVMIADWRRAFALPGMPFYFAQIAPFDHGNTTNSALLREAQLRSERVPHTGMAVTLDVGNARDIHPARKREIGERLAAWALRDTYGRPLPCGGPRYRAMRLEGSAALLSFDGVDGALELRPHPAGSGFEIAGSDGRFLPAFARVRGRLVEVSSPGVSAPVAVRYAFSNTPAVTLFDSAGQPAPSFRTEGR